MLSPEWQITNGEPDLLSHLISWSWSVMVMGRPLVSSMCEGEPRGKVTMMNQSVDLRGLQPHSLAQERVEVDICKHVGMGETGRCQRKGVVDIFY